VWGARNAHGFVTNVRRWLVVQVRLAGGGRFACAQLEHDLHQQVDVAFGRAPVDDRGPERQAAPS
jgi:hypothetical protein